MSFMLSVVIKSIMLNDIMLSVRIKSIMLSDIMLNVFDAECRN